MLIYVLTFLAMALGIVPFAALRYYPFLNKLRIRIRTLGFIFLAIILLETWSYRQIVEHGSWLGIGNADFFRSGFYLVYFLLSCIVIKEKLSHHILVWLISTSFGAVPLAVATFLEERIALPIPQLIFVLAILAFMPPYAWLSFYFLKKFIMPLMEESEEYTRFFTLVMLPVYLGILATVRGMTWESRIGMSPGALLSVRLIGFLQTAILCILFKKITDNRKRMDDLKEQQHSQEILLAISKQQFLALSEKIAEARRAKHDVKHHFTAIQAYLVQKNYAELARYVEESVKSCDFEQVLAFCENSTVNMILSHYYEYARREQIEINISACVPAVLPLSDADLWVLLGNLLENAVEGSKRITAGERQITVKLLVKGGSFGIIVENLYQEDTIQRQGEQFLSSKNTAGSGNGIASIQYFAQKHQGMAEFEARNGRFSASVYVAIKTGGSQPEC